MSLRNFLSLLNVILMCVLPLSGMQKRGKFVRRIDVQSERVLPFAGFASARRDRRQSQVFVTELTSADPQLPDVASVEDFPVLGSPFGTMMPVSVGSSRVSESPSVEELQRLSFSRASTPVSTPVGARSRGDSGAPTPESRERVDREGVRTPVPTQHYHQRILDWYSPNGWVARLQHDLYRYYAADGWSRVVAIHRISPLIEEYYGRYATEVFDGKSRQLTFWAMMRNARKETEVGKIVIARSDDDLVYHSCFKTAYDEFFAHVPNAAALVSSVRPIDEHDHIQKYKVEIGSWVRTYLLVDRDSYVIIKDVTDGDTLFDNKDVEYVIFKVAPRTAAASR